MTARRKKADRLISFYPEKTHAHCRSEPAREKPENAAYIQDARVIVDVLREQARSYRVAASNSVSLVSSAGSSGTCRPNSQCKILTNSPGSVISRRSLGAPTRCTA